MEDQNPTDGTDDPDGDGWMAPPDDDILEAMCDDDVFAPDHIDERGICRGPHAATRCRELATYGLLERRMAGVYDITDLGERYLAGEVDPSDLEPAE